MPPEHAISTDYLVVGSGLAGMGFVDTLLDVTDADIVIVDRHHAPGGHWNDSYPFVRLHQPSSSYGMGSTPLGNERLATEGRDKGLYDRASGSEVLGHFDAVMQQRFLPSGRVRYFPMSEYVGEGRFRSLVSGDTTKVEIRRKTVDATYNASEVPETYPPPFSVGGSVRLVTPGQLTRLPAPAPGYVVIGAGKTAMDTCTWLLDEVFERAEAMDVLFRLDPGTGVA